MISTSAFATSILYGQLLPVFTFGCGTSDQKSHLSPLTKKLLIRAHASLSIAVAIPVLQGGKYQQSQSPAALPLMDASGPTQDEKKRKKEGWYESGEELEVSGT